MKRTVNKPQRSFLNDYRVCHCLRDSESGKYGSWREEHSCKNEFSPLASFVHSGPSWRATVQTLAHVTGGDDLWVEHAPDSP